MSSMSRLTVTPDLRLQQGPYCMQSMPSANLRVPLVQRALFHDKRICSRRPNWEMYSPVQTCRPWMPFINARFWDGRSSWSLRLPVRSIDFLHVLFRFTYFFILFLMFESRPVKCVDCSGKLINFNEYEDHLLKYHRINGIFQSRAYVIYSMNLAHHQMVFGKLNFLNVSKFQCDWYDFLWIEIWILIFLEGEKCFWPQYYLKPFDNVTFILRLYATHWFVCAWVSLLGPKTDCAKYEALLEFQPNKDDDVNISIQHWRLIDFLQF